jgi:hypothetical protein
MRKQFLIAAASLAVMGVALAQIEASSSVYFLDVDPGRYGGPVGQRLALQLGDQPRHVALGEQDEICVQLSRAASDQSSISAQVRVIRPEPHAAAVVRVVGPEITPGTYRSTPWGMLLRALPVGGKSDGAVTGTADAPVCTL